MNEPEHPTIARLAEHHRLPPDLDPEYVARHRAWIARQPGFCGGYHLLDPDTGRALSFTLWQDEASLTAVERAQPAGPADGRVSRESRPTVRLVRVAATF